MGDRIVEIVAAIVAFIIGSSFGVGLARIVRRKGLLSIKLSRARSESAEALIALISDVERERELIPLVQSVQILKRHENSVDYRVDLGMGIVLARVTYRKSWNIKRQQVDWHSESGSFRLRHSGRIRFPKGRVELTTEYGSELPIIGPIMTLAAEGPVRLALSVWLARLDKAAR